MSSCLFEFTVVIAAKTDADMAQLLEKMAHNVIDGCGDEYFSKSDVENANGDLGAMRELLDESEASFHNYFSSDPEEYELMDSDFQGPTNINGHEVVMIKMSTTEYEYETPTVFCKTLDSARFGYSVVCVGIRDDMPVAFLRASNADDELGLDLAFDEELESIANKACEEKETANTPQEIAYYTSAAALDTEYDFDCEN